MPSISQKNVIKNTCFILTGCLFFILIVEIFLIVLEPLIPVGFYQYDPDLGFRVRPYAKDTNQFGFNDRDYSLEPEEGVVRVLFVSDSFSWAGGIRGRKKRGFDFIFGWLFYKHLRFL